METNINEIADGIYRLSTFVPDVVPTGFTFNQFLIDADQPLLFHTGPRAMFPSVSSAIATVMPTDRLRWITFGHLESDRSRGAQPAHACDHARVVIRRRLRQSPRGARR